MFVAEIKKCTPSIMHHMNIVGEHSKVERGVMKIHLRNLDLKLLRKLRSYTDCINTNLIARNRHNPPQTNAKINLYSLRAIWIGLLNTHSRFDFGKSLLHIETGSA